jgi:hypothetical protein
MMLKVIGIIACILGLAIRYIVNRRRFNRRSPQGVQLFDNYEKAFFTTLGEKVAKIIELVLILGGSFFYVLSNF